VLKIYRLFSSHTRPRRLKLCPSMPCASATRRYVGLNSRWYAITWWSGTCLTVSCTSLESSSLLPWNTCRRTQTCTISPTIFTYKSVFLYKLVRFWHQFVICSVRRITQWKFKGLLDWSSKNVAYIELWNQRQPRQMYYLSGGVHTPRLYKEYLRWLHLQSRLFLKPAYTEEHIA
jgi:hypothetical protein